MIFFFGQFLDRPPYSLIPEVVKMGTFPKKSRPVDTFFRFLGKNGYINESSILLAGILDRREKSFKIQPWWWWWYRFWFSVTRSFKKRQNGFLLLPQQINTTRGRTWWIAPQDDFKVVVALKTWEPPPRHYISICRQNQWQGLVPSRQYFSRHFGFSEYLRSYI